jgi:hypothetical protein
MRGCGRVCQSVSEKLSIHVLHNWDRFVEGVNEVASVERDLEVRSSCLTLAAGLPLRRQCGDALGGFH